MRSIAGYLLSTIGRKQMTAVAGIGLALFVLTHVAGNSLMFVGDRAYNMYSHNLISNPLIYIAEAGLLAIFVLHTIIGIYLTAKNWGARPSRYAVGPSGDKATPLVMRTMFIQGIVIVVFLVLHLITFKFGPHYTISYDGLEVRDLFRLLYEVFQSPVYVAWYVVAVSILGFHLSHGVYSSLQTLGVNHPAYNSKIKMISVAYGVLIGIGFAIQPIYMMFIYKP